MINTALQSRKAVSFYFTSKQIHVLSFSAETVFRRQNLTSKDGPRTERIYKNDSARIQMKREELTKMISN